VNEGRAVNRVFLLRLTFDFVAASILLFCLSYWWLGNVAHEIAGTAMFLLVFAHNVFNRRWYGRIDKARRQARGLFDLAVIVALLITMTALLVSSIPISHALVGLSPLFGGLAARQLHTLAAYWALVVVSIHLGLRLPIVMGATRTMFGMSGSSSARTFALRIVAIVVAIQGVRSSVELGLGTKLAMQVTLDWWNFEESVVGFFAHCISIAGLYMFLTYYALVFAQYAKRTSSSAASVPEDVRQ
jgi:hypothetical protein